MHLDQVIYEHAEWKNRFRAAVTHHEPMDAASIGADTCCNLGKWLHGEGKLEFEALPAYAFLIEKHADFHREAGRVAALINAMDYAAAEAELEYGSAYFRAAQEVAIAIMALHEVIQQERS